MSSPEEARRWIEQWRRAGPALAAVRARELREMTDDDARRACEALLSLAATAPVPEHRLRTSGLVEQQALFHQQR